MDDIPEAAAPLRVDLDRRAGTLVLEWHDASESRFDLDELRRGCPCAECRTLRERDQPIGPSDSAVTAVDGELVGNWGLQITWSDGHSTGIYAWGVLRAWADDRGTTSNADDLPVAEISEDDAS